MGLDSRSRGVAQLGSAFGLGPKGRWFESSRPDFCIWFRAICSISLAVGYIEAVAALPPVAYAARIVVTLGILGAWLAVPVPAVAERVDGTVRWDLAAGHGRLTTDTRQVRISVAYGACSGAPGTPRVRRTERSVVITVPLPPGEPLAPGEVCPLIEYVKTMTVRLRGRLGCRALRDGSRTPPRFVARARR